MAQYKVESELLDGFKVGDVISDSDFPEGTNIDALLDGGFITAKTNKPADKQTEAAKD